MTARLRRILEDIRSAHVRTAALKGALILFSFVFLVSLLLIVLDNLFAVGPLLRAFLGGFFLLGSAILFFLFILRPLVKERPAEFWALVLEKNFPVLDSRLINALLLEKNPRGRLSETVALITAREAELLAREIRIPRFLEKSSLKRFSILAALSSSFLFLYAVFFPGAFFNAFQRYVTPFSGPVHFSGPNFQVFPGDLVVKPGERVRVRVEFPSTKIPPKAFVWRESLRLPMSFNGKFFYFSFPPVGTEGFRYRVEAGKVKSRWYRVKVLKPPSLTTLTLVFRFPEYTGLPARFEENAKGDINVLKGTRVEVRARADKALSAGKLRVCGKEKDLSIRNRFWAVGEFEVQTNGVWSLEVVGRDAGLKSETKAYPVRVVPDKAPRAYFLRPKTEGRFFPGGAVSVCFRGEDDFGVQALYLEASQSEGGPWKVISGKKSPRRGKRFLQSEVVVRPRGEVLYLRSWALDDLGQKGVSQVLVLRAMPFEALREKELDLLTSAVLSLGKLLELQMALKQRTGRLLDSASREEISACRSEQRKIASSGQEILQTWETQGLSAGQKVKFEAILRGPMKEVCSLFDEVLFEREILPKVKRILKVQEEIIRKLRELIGALEEIRELVQNEGVENAEIFQKALRKKQELEELKEKLERFVEEERRILNTSEKLLGKRPDDFTGEEQALLKELSASEEKWAGIISNLASDYAKLSPQDMADSTLVEELMEIFSEVDAASRALEKKALEVAVPLEQSGLELAEELTVNIERWLSKEPDRIKWVMEDPPVSIEVPLVDLPQELEDIVGDLIDREEDMTEEVEDVTSGWIDSLNEGAGWTAMDGPISNMSARGVTGKLLPNKNEIGGRSGEGRSGRSHGQMVEKQASGKGGRPTPTRVTPDPFEAGQVVDKGKDPTGGSTGGGKLAGTAPGGLLGPVSPDLGDKLRKLGRRQEEVRTRAQRAKRRLRFMGIPAERLDRIVKLMELMEKASKRGEAGEVSALHSKILLELKSLEEEGAERIARLRERRAPFLYSIQDVFEASDEPVPEPYRDYVRNYYEALTGFRRPEKK